MATREEDLLAAVYAEPASDAPRAVYADWLLDQGHPLGEFIQLQLARAKGKKGTGAKEKRLFNPTWWPGHPLTSVNDGAIRYEHTERGFPAVFSPALPVDDASLRQTLASWRPLIGHAGWSTVRAVTVYAPRDAFVGELLAGSRMPLLEKVDYVGPASLKAMAAVELPIRELSVQWGDPGEPPKLTGLAQLEALEVDAPSRLELVEKMGVLGRITRLALGYSPGTALVRGTLDLFAAAPPNVKLLKVRGYDFNWAQVERGVGLTVHVTAHAVREAAEELRQLAPGSLEGLKVVFAEGGFYTKRTRPQLQQLVREATAHLSNVTLEMD